MGASTVTVNRERSVRVQNGWVFLVLVIALIVADLALFILAAPACAVYRTAVMAATRRPSGRRAAITLLSPSRRAAGF